MRFHFQRLLHIGIETVFDFFPIQILNMVFMLMRNVFATLRDYVTKVNTLIELGLPVVALNEETTVLQVVLGKKKVKEVLRERGFLISLPFENGDRICGGVQFS